MNTITLLTGDRPSRKCFPSVDKDFPYLHEYSVQEINSLLDIKQLIETTRNNPFNYFIRGVPNNLEKDGRFRRLKVNTIDNPLNWIMLDIDGVGRDLPLQSYLIENLPFITKDTEMLIDYSSKEGVYGDVDYRNKYYAHVYLWSDTALTSQEWKDRFIGYDFVDCALFNVVQPHYYVEPQISEPYQTTLKERTIYIPGKAFTPEKTPGLIKDTFQTTAHKGGKAIDLEVAFKELLKPGQRHNGLHKFFCKAVSQGADQEYWINKYWKSPQRSPDHNNIQKVSKAMDNAKEFIYRKFTNDIANNYPTIHLDKENLQEAISYHLGTNYFIKSGMMTWKTQSLKNIPETTNGRPTRILMVGHRVNLIRSICKDLGMEIYSDLGEYEEFEGKDIKRRFWLENKLGITFDSLWRVFDNGKAPQYDYLILDESEQVIAELLTTTRTQEESPGFEHKRIQQTSELRSKLGRAIQASTSVICLDADLGNLTTWFIEDWKTSNFIFYHNQYKSFEGRTFKLTPSIDYTWQQIEEDIYEGKKVYVNCDTKAKAKALHLHLETIFDPPSQRGGRMAKGLIIDGDNSGLKKHKALAENPNEVIPDLMRRGLKWLITTPTFETGISIGKPEIQEYRFHSAYLLWTWNNYTANTARQAICRVRNADNYYVFIPGGFDKPLDITKLLDFIENQSNNPRQIDRTEYLKRYVNQQKENSQTNKTIHFQLLIEEIGGRLKRIKEPHLKGSSYNDCMKAVKEEEINRILQATDIEDENAYQELGFTQDDRYKRYRYEVQKTFNTRKINKTLIKRWDFGRIEYRWQLRMLLERDINDLEGLEESKLLADSKHTPFIHRALTEVLQDFGITDLYEQKLERVFIAEHISEETLDWICNEDVLNALKHLLAYHHIQISDIQKLRAEPLRLYKKLAWVLCFSVTHFGARDKDLDDAPLEDIKKQYRENQTYEKYGHELNWKQKKETNEATNQILKRRMIDRADDLSDIEIKYYRKRNPHLLLKQYKPAYVGNFRENLSDNKFHVGEIISDKNINSNQAIAGFEIC